MDIISVVATVFSFYVFFALVNVTILCYFQGVLDSTFTRFANEVWLSDKVYKTYDSIYVYKSVNLFRWKWFVFIVFCPVFNIIWSIVTVYKLHRFYKKHF